MAIWWWILNGCYTRVAKKNRKIHICCTCLWLSMAFVRTIQFQSTNCHKHCSPGKQKKTMNSAIIAEHFNLSRVNLIWNRLAAAKSTFMLHLKYTIEFFRASGSTQIIKLGLHSHKFNADSVNYFHSTEYHSICCCHACCRCSTSILFMN